MNLENIKQKTEDVGAKTQQNNENQKTEDKNIEVISEVKQGGDQKAQKYRKGNFTNAKKIVTNMDFLMIEIKGLKAVLQKRSKEG